MDYLERKRAQINIGHALQKRGWTLWGYHAEESDPMADYRAPASWLGVTTHTDHPGVVTCVVVSDTHRSGWLEPEEEYRAAGPCTKCDGTGIWPGGLSYAEAVAQPERQHFAAYCAERNSEPMFLSAVSPLHYHDDGSPRCLVCNGRKFRYECVTTGQKQWPVFHQTPRGRAWHVESGGTIRQSGTGLQAAASYSGGEAAAERIADEIVSAVRSLQPAAQASRAAATDLGACQLMHDRDWTWLKFDTKPSDAVREALRQQLGASFSAKRMAWYTRRHVEADEVRIVIEAAQLADNGSGSLATPRRADDEQPAPLTDEFAVASHSGEAHRMHATQDVAAQLSTLDASRRIDA
jgi:hypothetical protein